MKESNLIAMTSFVLSVCAGMPQGVEDIKRNMRIRSANAGGGGGAVAGSGGSGGPTVVTPGSGPRKVMPPQSDPSGAN